MSFMDSLLGLFSGCYDNLDFNVHLWFLPCFFVTVALFNILVNLGGKKIAYIVSALMSLIYLFIIIPAIGSGIIITIQSWINFSRDKSLMNLGVAGWNTFARTYSSC